MAKREHSSSEVERHSRANALRVLVVSSMYPTAADPIGGIFVHEQVKALRAAGIDARVVSGKPLLIGRNADRHLGGWPVASARSIWQQRPTRMSPTVRWTDHDGVPVIYFRFLAGELIRPWLYPWMYWWGLRRMLAGLADEFGYDLVHTHTAFLDGRAGGLAAQQRCTPMVLTEHTGPFSIVTTSRLFRAHVEAGLAAATRIIAVSHALRAEMRARLPRFDLSGVVVVPNGVDTAFFDPTLGSPPASPRSEAVTWASLAQAMTSERVLARLDPAIRDLADRCGREPATLDGLLRAVEAPAGAIGAEDRESTRVGYAEPGPPSRSRTPIRALWVGYLVEVKRVDRLLQALAIARRHRPALVLTVLGGGELGERLRGQAIRLGLRDAISFELPGSREQVRRAIAACDFLVISSETETFGVVGIEALAMGVPVLSTRCGGPADYLDDPAVGELVDNTTEDLAIGLQIMCDRIDGFDRRAIREHAIRRFDFAAVARQLLAVYEEVVRP